MRVIWIGQQYGGGLRECTFIDEAEQSTFFAIDEQAREFAVEMDATIREAASYELETNGGKEAGYSAVFVRDFIGS